MIYHFYLMNDPNDPLFLFSSVEHICLLCDLSSKQLCAGFHSLLIFACLNTLSGTIVRLKYFIDVFH